MILQNGSPSLLASLTTRNPDAEAALEALPRVLIARSQIIMLMSEMGEPIGYALMARDDETDERLMNALYGLWVDPTLDEPYGKVLTNLLRSLRLSSMLVRSNDATNMKELLHYPMEHQHLTQVYRVVPQGNTESLEKGSSMPAAATRASSTPGTYGAPLLLDPTRLDQILRLSRSGRTLASVEVYKGIEANTCFLFPSVAPAQRREGFGLQVVVSAAELLLKKGITPLLPVDPTDDAARRFAQQSSFVSEYDFMRVTPRFHLPPYPVLEEEFTPPRRRRRKSLE